MHNSFDQRHSCRTRIAESGATLNLGGGAGQYSVELWRFPATSRDRVAPQVPIAVGTMGIPIKHKARREP